MEIIKGFSATVPWRVEYHQSGWCDGCRRLLEWVIKRDLTDIGLVEKEIEEATNQACGDLKEEWKDVPWNVSNGYGDRDSEYEAAFKKARKPWDDYIDYYGEAEAAHLEIMNNTETPVVYISVDYEEFRFCPTCLSLMMEELSEKSQM